MVEMGPAPRTAEWAGGLIFSLPLHPFVIIRLWLSTSHLPNETCTRQPLPPAQTYPESGVHLYRLLKTPAHLHTLTHILSKYIFYLYCYQHSPHRQANIQTETEIFSWMGPLHSPPRRTFNWKTEVADMLPWAHEIRAPDKSLSFGFRVGHEGCRQDWNCIHICFAFRKRVLIRPQQEARQCWLLGEW